MENNELLQAILSEIKDIKQKQDKMQGDISGMQGDISGMKGDISNMQGDISGMKNDILKINITLENETNRKIDLMYGSHQDMIKKLKKTDEIDETKSRVSVLETVVTKHTDDIRQLKTKIS